MGTSLRHMDKEDLYGILFPFVVENGLENVSIREMCRGTGVPRATLYYWFEDKTSIIIKTTEYGLKSVMDEIFEYAFSNFSDLRRFFSECLSEIDKHKKELRFAYQLATSPSYGDKMRREGLDFDYKYWGYAKRLAAVMGCEPEKIKPLVSLFVSAVTGYIVRGDREGTQAQLDVLYEILPQFINV